MIGPDLEGEGLEAAVGQACNGGADGVRLDDDRHGL